MEPDGAIADQVRPEGSPHPHLREREDRAAQALRLAQVGYWEHDMATGEITVSEEACRIIGVRPEEYAAAPVVWDERWLDLVEPEDRARTRLAFQEAIRDGKPYDLEFRVHRTKGEPCFLRSRGEVSRDAAGRPCRIFGTVQDNTEPRRREETQRANELRLRAFVDHASDAIFIQGEQGRIHDVNRQACVSLGYTRKELIGKVPQDFDPDFTKAMMDEMEVKHRSGLVSSFETRHRRKDGTIFPVEIRVRPFWEGQERFIVAIARDITERRQTERRIGHLNRTYAVLSEINQLIVRVRDPGAIVDGACRIAVEKGGFRLAWIGMLDTTGEMITPVASAEMVNGHLNVATADPAGVVAMASGRRPIPQALLSGQHQVCNDIDKISDLGADRDEAVRRGYRALAAFPLKVGGRTTGTFNLYADERGVFDSAEVRLLDELAVDISFALEGCEREQERQRALEKLSKSEELFRELAETIQEVFWVTAPDRSRTLYISPAYEKIWQRSRETVYQRPESWVDAIHEEDRDRVVQAAATQQTEGRYDEEYRIVRPDGQVRWIREMAFPVRNAASQVERIVGVARDITDRRQMGEQLRQAQKMEAIGQLAGGVAHDFNNILTVMIMEVELTRIVKGLPPEALEFLTALREAAERAAKLTRQLLLFSSRQVMQPQKLDLNELVTNLAKMLERIIGADVRLHLNIHPRPLVTRADGGMVDQVLMNLVVNARDAMPDGGSLTIATGEAVWDEALAQMHPQAAPGRYVFLSVTDTGSGIAPANLPHIFEPFFTTKEVSKGTGLGLATIFGIVKQHGGSIAVDTMEGRGTTFQVLFPAAEGVPLPPVDARSRRSLTGGRETILLVEDDPMVRGATRTILTHHGYRILEAANGVDALQVWQSQRDNVSLLLTDLVMPSEVGGQELARRLQIDRPDLKVVYTSGYSADMAGRHLELNAGENFLPKPFQIEALLEVVRRSLDS